MGIRTKLVIAFAGLLLIVAVVGVLSVHTLNESSLAIERILRENYDTVAACDHMKVALERLDRQAELCLWEVRPEVCQQSQPVLDEFDQNLRFQQGNITVPGEQEVTDRLTESWKGYKRDLENFYQLSNLAARRELYRHRLLPRSQEIREAAQKIIEMNLNNMVAADGQAQQRAAQTRKAMLFLLFIGIGIGVGFTVLAGPAILRPIASLTHSVREIQQGNLDLVVNVRSQDEIGQLGAAINQMAASLREFRRSDQAHLLRTQRSTQLALDSLSEAVAICSSDGKIELANDVAQRLFGLAPESTVDETGNEKISQIFWRVSRQERPYRPKGYEGAIQIFMKEEEHFFLPQAIPIFDQERQLAGVTLMLTDVTLLRHLDEVKTGLISTVSHELKTPLTSIRLAIHILLNEKLGPLSSQQMELLVTAREDSDRLYRVIEDLLDISRIESGQAEIKLQPVNVEELILQATDKMRPAFRDHGITFNITVAPDVPRVLADPSRLQLVFDNLLSNTLKYTRIGGEVTIKAELDDSMVRFYVEDTGIGIAPEFLPRIFEKFFRVPGQEQISSGLGLTITKEIVEAHGGAIEVASQPGKGTKFSFTVKAMQESGSNLL
jgi:signal transduction histidine kinase/HAMP domain-containing protein